MSSEKICISLSTHPIQDPIFWSSMLSTFASIATIIAACLTGFAVYVALKQIKTSHTQNAIGLYNQYLQLCIQYPQLASGMKKPSSKDCSSYAQYLWFVTTMLNCFEQILLSCGDDHQWINTITIQLSKHKEALLNSGALERDEWEPELLVIIKEVVKSEES